MGFGIVFYLFIYIILNIMSNHTRLQARSSFKQNSKTKFLIFFEIFEFFEFFDFFKIFDFLFWIVLVNESCLYTNGIWYSVLSFYIYYIEHHVKSHPVTSTTVSFGLVN
jgi:hypothetical protein